MSIYLLRHGQTEWAINGRHTGLTDIPLTEHGKEQAREAGKRLAALHPSPFDEVYTSPLRRARDTALIAGEYYGFHDMKVISDAHEWDYGFAEGLSTKDIRSMLPENQNNWRIWDKDAQDVLADNEISYQSHPDEYRNLVQDAHYGEAPNDVFDRALRVLDTCYHDESQDVLIVAHAHIIRFLAAAWVNDIHIAEALDISPARIGILSVSSGNHVITGWGL